MKPMRPVGTWLSLAAVIGGLALMAPNTQAQSSNEVHLVEIQGTVEVSTDGGIRWVKTTTSQSVRAGDHLRTGPNSRAALRWSDSSVVSCKALTEIEILPPHAPQAQAGLRIFEGLLSFFHRDRPGRIRVITRGTAAGINGTEFVIAVDTVNGAERTTLSIIDGIVSFSNEVNTLTLTNGEQAVATPGSAPQRTAGFVVNNLLQWAFYYPAVLDLRDMTFSRDEEQALAESLAAYRAGDLLDALAKYGNRQPASEAERIYQAALLLAVGEVDQTSNALAQIDQGNPSERGQRLAAALRQQIAAVKRDVSAATRNPELATELLAASYYEQSRAVGDETLKRALDLAKRATTNSPEFGFAWARVAELEFSFGRTDKANDALNKSLALSPRNAQALALKGFLLAAQNKPREAIEWFDRALAVDSALGNAWLGRGLCRIRRGDRAGGREDLLIAAALEQRRGQLRSYLGKSFGDAGDKNRALHELDLAKELDPADPTAWFYSALIKAENNRINEAIDDLEHSQELNDNRSVYRSSVLLDQDQAAHSANLARIYADAGMSDVAVREASRSVAHDYNNHSAHLFLAQSYRAARNATLYDQRFETVAQSEYLLAQLLGPADGRLLAQSVSQGEYSPLFQSDRFGFSSFTEYLGRGAFGEAAAAYGTYGNSSFSLESVYVTDPGETRFSEMETRYLSAKIKQQLSQDTGVFFQIQDFRQETGDVAQRYDTRQTSRQVWTDEKQRPNVLVGLNHRWNESHLSLFLFTHIDDSFVHTNFHGGTYLVAESGGTPFEFVPTDLSQRFRSRVTVDSFDLQHIFAASPWQTIAGARFQTITDRISNEQRIFPGNAIDYEIYFGPQGSTITNQHVRVRAYRFSPYLYQHWKPIESLLLIAGVTYDVQQQPENSLFAPVSVRETTRHQVSPKAALVWTPVKRLAVRAAYAQSLGGVDLDQSIRLEPSQLAGFVQSYRTLFPNSLVGRISGAEMETSDVSIEYRWPTRTYIAVGAQRLESEADHRVGAFRREDLTAQGPPAQLDQRLRFVENSAELNVHQLLGEMFSTGLRYRFSAAELRISHPSLPSALQQSGMRELEGQTHLLGLSAGFHHPIGLFAGVEARYWAQDLDASLRGLKPDAFWQMDIIAGYRWWQRRAEVSVGLLNATDKSYRLHPINLHPDLPQERTFFARLKLHF